jgi:hypothetical protein
MQPLSHARLEDLQAREGNVFLPPFSPSLTGTTPIELIAL